MKCPKKSKVCNPAWCLMTDKKDYICCGNSKYPTTFKEDRIWLCLKGKISKVNIEMTKEEALHIITALSQGLLNDKI